MMKPIQTFFTLFLAVTLLLGGCAGSGQAESPEAPTAPSEETSQTQQAPEPSQSEQAAASEAEETETAATPETPESSESEQAATASEAEETETAQTEETAEVAAAAGGETYEVKMGSDTGQLKYVPERLTVHPGDKIKFVMNKLAPHNVVFDSNNVPSGAKALASSLSKNKLLSTPGEAHIVKIPDDAPKGEYNYYCQPHSGAGMNGTIIVE